MGNGSVPIGDRWGRGTRRAVWLTHVPYARGKNISLAILSVSHIFARLSHGRPKTLDFLALKNPKIESVSEVSISFLCSLIPRSYPTTETLNRRF